MTMQKKPKVNMRKMFVRVLFVSVLIYSGYILTSQQLTLHQKQKVVDECITSNTEAKNENAKLKEEAELMDTDEYIEHKIREELGYIRPEEMIFVDVNK
jgi:cell division protein FtsB